MPLSKLTRSLPRSSRKCSGEIGLARETERKGNVNQRPIVFQQQPFRALKAPGADIAKENCPIAFLKAREKCTALSVRRDDCDEMKPVTASAVGIAEGAIMDLVELAGRQTNVDDYAAGRDRALQGGTGTV
jgi:hypothetical protein